MSENSILFYSSVLTFQNQTIAIDELWHEIKKLTEALRASTLNSEQGKDKKNSRILQLRFSYIFLFRILRQNVSIHRRRSATKNSSAHRKQ
jgi:hypothetical protein